MKCRKCESSNSVKAGFIRGIQRYKCKECFYFFSVKKKSDVKTKEQKRLALEMYLGGMGFRSIGRILDISYGTIYKWVKKWGEHTELPQSDKPIEIFDLDEIHGYVENIKKTVGRGLLLVNLDSSISTFFIGNDVEKPLKSSKRS